jgi:glyoxylase-like metal-dependent hydrolase (beta-lactamase superfamily II)
MYELIRAGESTYYIDCPAKVGIYLRESGEAYLIDGGFDKEAGRKIRQILDQNGWRLAAVIATHSHADHIGGVAYLQAQTGCRVYANGMEAAFVRNPILEPSFLFSGYPVAELRHKFFLAQPSVALDFSDEGFPPELDVIPLPGHTFDMAGIRTPDGVAFLADCVSGPSTLAKYGVPFLYDVGAYLQTLDQVEAMQAVLFVPSHAQATADIAPLVRLNREKVLEIGENLLSICETPRNFEAILQSVFHAYNLKMSFEQYALVGGTVKSYLAYLKETGKIVVSFRDNLLLWGRA